MRLIIKNNSNEVSEWIANYIINKIIEYKPTSSQQFVLALPSGSSSVGIYKELVKLYKKQKITFQYVIVFSIVSFVGVPQDSDFSVHKFLWNNFFKYVDVNPENVFILNGNDPDLEKQCILFEKTIVTLGPINLLISDVTVDGFVGYNEPGSSLTSRTRVKVLAYQTREYAKKRFNSDVVPTMALTMGIGTMMEADEIMFIITGSHKAITLKKVMEEGVNHMFTISMFQQHPKVLIVCDEDATMELKVKIVKYSKEVMEAYDSDHFKPILF